MAGKERVLSHSRVVVANIDGTPVTSHTVLTLRAGLLSQQSSSQQRLRGYQRPASTGHEDADQEASAPESDYRIPGGVFAGESVGSFVNAWCRRESAAQRAIGTRTVTPWPEPNADSQSDSHRG